jgi:enamine deaminase RidA (YjgF/YER057c/UK114 family)
VSSHSGDTPDDVFPDDPKEQLRGAFLNIALLLPRRRATWSDVVEINSYHVGLRSQADFLLSVAAEFLKSPYPAWTPVDVTDMWPPQAVVEISCVAVVGHRGH